MPGCLVIRAILEDIQVYAGALPDSVGFFEACKCGYDVHTLYKLLCRDGIREIRSISSMSRGYQALRIDDRSSAASAAHEHGHYSFVEATH